MTWRWIVVAMLLPALAHAQEELPEYQKKTTVSGKLKSVGSSTISNLMARWVESFKRIHPEMELEITGGGSSTAPPALLAGKCDLAPMSRSMNQKERDAFAKQFGYSVTEIRVAVDALAVYVNRDNPVKGLTLAQLDAIYSSTRLRGGKPARTWGDVGLEGDWTARLVRPVGYDSGSTGAYAIFKETVLSGGEFCVELRTQTVSSAIVQNPAAEPEAIAYASAFFKTKRTRIVPLSTDGMNYHLPTVQTALSGEYPLARFLYVYINRHPEKGIEPKAAEFLRFVLSRSGQNVVQEDGNFPLDAKHANEELAKLK